MHFLQWLNPDFLLRSLDVLPVWFMALALFAVVFAESGLFFGFFLPGDSFLFTAGLFVAEGHISIPIGWLVALFFIAAVAGDSVGYTFGQVFGRRFFTKPDSIFRDPHHLEKAEAFFARYGRKTVIMARFVPAVRTFAPIAAGISTMNYRTFIVYNIVGGVLWTSAITLLGYFLGRVVPDVDRYIIPILLLIIVLSVAQPAWHIWQDPNHRQRLLARVGLGAKS